MQFDPNDKQIRNMYLGTVHNGQIEYRKSLDAEGICAGWRRRRAILLDLRALIPPTGSANVAVFGPQAPKR